MGRPRKSAARSPRASQKTPESSGIPKSAKTARKNSPNRVNAPVQKLTEIITKRVLTRTAKNKWEELAPDCHEELVNLFSMHVEPALSHLSAAKSRKEARKVLNAAQTALDLELDGVLVPAGFSRSNYNFDHLYRKARRMQQQHSEDLVQIAELEKTLLRESQKLAVSKDYLKKLEKSYGEEKKKCAATKKMLRLGEHKEHLILPKNAPSLPQEAESLLQSTLPSEFDGSHVADENYDPGKDRDILRVFAQLSGVLDDNNVEALRELKASTSLHSKRG